MKSDEEIIKWCLKQNKGIRLVNPNENLCKEYLSKSKSSLNMLDAAVERNEIDWIITIAYYARYFALYALLQKCGIKSEIHDCSISALKYLFVNESIVEEGLFTDVSSSKQLRIDVQYYVRGELSQDEIKKNVDSARVFVLRIELIIENITEEQINLVRGKIQELIDKL